MSELDLISEFYGGFRYFGYWSSPQGYGNQFRVYSKEDIIKLMNTWNGAMNCGISMCTFKGEVPFLLYLAFDFDSNSLEKSWEDAKKFYNFMVDSDYDITINYSGYRGFHCLLSVEPDYYSRGQIKAAHEWFKDTLQLETCDPQIFGDIRRLIRIPGSLHAGKFKKVKGKGWRRQGEGGYCYNIKHHEGNLFNLDDNFTDPYPEYDFDMEHKSNGHIQLRPCVERAMDNKEPAQLIRYSYTAYLLKKGKTPEDILSMYKERHSDGKEYEWDDWDEDITMNQILHIAGNSDYNQLRCSTLKSLEYCYKECRYNNDDWLNKKAKEIE